MSLSAKFSADFSSFYEAVQKAEVSLKSFEEGSGKVAGSLNRMTDSFTGRKVIQEAALMSEAIERAGGMSTLTSKELERAGSKAAEAAEKMNRLGLDVPPNIQKLVDATTKVAPQLTLADKAAGLLKSTFAQFTAANLAASAIASLSAGLQQFIDIGVKLPAVELSFVRLSASARQSSGEMLEAMRQGTLGLVSNYDLMLAANKAMLLGIPVTSASMGQMAEAATKLGRAMGKDAASSIDDLITALGRSSPMILDNLGLTVRVGEANQAYAERLGKTSEQLTDAERKMAFYEAAMEAARKKTAELGDQTKTLGEIAATAWTQFGNVVSAGAATVNVGMGAVLSDSKQFAQFIKDAMSQGMGMALQMASTRAQMEQLQKAGAAAANAMPVDPLVRYRGELDELRASIGTLTPVQQALARDAIALGQSTAEIATKIGASTQAVAAFAERLKASKDAADKKKDALDELVVAGEGWRGTLAKMDQVMVTALANYLRAGVSQSTLAVAYGITATQVKAVASALAEEDQAQQKAEQAARRAAEAKDRAIQQTSKLWNEYHELVVQQSGTATEIQIAEIRRWAADVEAQAIRAGAATSEFYEALEATTKQKLAGVKVDWDALRDHSRLKLDETAEKARATYEAMVARSGEFSFATIEEFRKTAEAAELAAAMWGTSFTETLTDLDTKTSTTASRMSAAAQGVALSWSAAMALVSKGMGTLSGSVPQGSSWGFSGPGKDTAFKPIPGVFGMAGGLPSFASGVTNFGGGLAKVHKDELLVNLPAGTDVIPAPVASTGRAMTFAPVVNISAGMGSNPAEIARLVKSALVDMARSMGQRLPLGVS